MTVAIWAQAKMATVDDSGRLEITTTSKKLSIPQSRRSAPKLHDGFPLVVPADASFKNFRNVTLHDLDGDGAAEILFGSADQFYCYEGSTERWVAELSGSSRFPAAIGDLDGDGQEEIVVTTGFSDAAGSVYALDGDGNLVEPWPLEYGGQWKISSPALADVDRDGDLEIAFGDLQGSLGSLHLVHHDGSVFAGDWPLDLPNIPAVTPSVADIDNDGTIDLVISTTRELYVLTPEGGIKTGWPVGPTGTKYSFQSPVLADLSVDGNLEIIGTGHGDNPLFYVYDATGTSLSGWPLAISGWSFHPPTVFSYADEVVIINAKPGTSEVQEMLFARNSDGETLPGYPIRQQGGHEGVTTVADVDGDGDPDLVFSINLITADGEGLVYAYDFLSGSLLEGYPLVQRGWTYMNGATFADIDGDADLDMVVLAYTENAGNIPDTTFIYAYDLGVPAERVWWPTYKGSNDRAGKVDLGRLPSSTREEISAIKIFPNPTRGQLHLDLAPTNSSSTTVRVFSSSGQQVAGFVAVEKSIDLSGLTAGIYFLEITLGKKRKLERVIVD